MFIIKPIKAEEAIGELNLYIKKFGFIPAYFELFATLDSQLWMDFIEYIYTLKITQI